MLRFTMTGVALCWAAQWSARAATFTWDGDGNDNNWSTNNNWDSNTSPPNSSPNDDFIFAGSTQLSNNANSGQWHMRSLSFASGAGTFNLNGNVLNIGSGGITNNSTNTQTIANQITLSANQTWNAANGGITLTNSWIDGNGKTLTLDGSSTITTTGQLGGVGTLVTTGSGNRIFSGTVSANTMSLGGTASSNIIFSGAVNGNNGMTITSSGNVTFNGSINSGSLTLNGTGITTISGSGSMSTGAVTVNSGTLVMDHSGAAINSSLTVNNGGTVVFSKNNQVPTWQTVTLNEGGTLNLNDTSQTIANLIITGDSIIDFGTGGAQLNVQSWGSIDIADDITITLKNWNDAVDVFSGKNPGDDVVVNIEYADNDGNVYAYGTWSGGYIVPGAPVPEPATYGLLLVGGLVTLVANRRPSRAA